MKTTKEMIIKMIGFFKQNYGLYENAGDEDIKLIVDTWYWLLKDYESVVVKEAIKKVLVTCKYKPTIAHIVEQIELMEQANQPSDQELWLELERAIKKVSWLQGSFYYTYVPEGETKTQGELAREEVKQIFNGLNEVIKAYVVSDEGLLRLIYIDLDFEKSRFIKALPQIRQRQKVLKEMPKELLEEFDKKLLTNI